MDTEFRPKIVMFCCNWCSYAASDAAGVARMKIKPYFNVIRVMCTGRVDPLFILQAFILGADGVMVAGCHPGECHYRKGNLDAYRRISFLRSVLAQAGLGERLEMHFIAAGEPNKFQVEVNRFVEKIQTLGPSPLKGKNKKPLEEPTKRQTLLSALTLIFNMTGAKPEPWSPASEEEMIEGFGFPVYDPDKCLGCGACMRLCPEEAIRFDQIDGTQVISHFYSNCITCRKCEENCPYEAVKVEKGFELQSFLQHKAIKDLDMKLRKCSVCGRYFAPECLLDDIKKKEELKFLPSEIFEICPDCKRNQTAGEFKKIFNLEPLGIT